MALRIFNDDPRCLQPRNCQIRSIGHTELCARCRNTAGKRPGGPKPYNPPDELEAMYVDLKRKFGRPEAVRLIEEQIRVKRGNR